MKKILITARSMVHTPKAIELLKQHGYEILDNPYYGKTLTEEQMLDVIEEADGAIVGMELFTEKLYEKAKHLKVVQRTGIGYDTVNVELANKYGVAVGNVTGASTNSVAELTLCLMIAASRKVTSNCARVQKGMWTLDMGNELHGKTLGVVGFGRIGQAVAKMCRYAFDMEVVAFDYYPQQEVATSLGVKMVSSLEELLPLCDYITIHLPRTAETIDLFSKERIGMMKDGSYLINVARGGIVNEDALYEALTNGKLAGAATDVLAVEPPKERSRLLDLDNLVMTSHIGGNTIEANELISRTAVENVMAVLEGRECRYIVNRKELEDRK